MSEAIKFENEFGTLYPGDPCAVMTVSRGNARLFKAIYRGMVGKRVQVEKTEQQTVYYDKRTNEKTDFYKLYYEIGPSNYTPEKMNAISTTRLEPVMRAITLYNNEVVPLQG